MLVGEKEHVVCRRVDECESIPKDRGSKIFDHAESLGGTVKFRR